MATPWPSIGSADSEKPSDQSPAQQVEVRSTSKRARSAEEVEPWTDFRGYMTVRYGGGPVMLHVYV